MMALTGKNGSAMGTGNMAQGGDDGGVSVNVVGSGFVSHSTVTEEAVTTRYCYSGGTLTDIRHPDYTMHFTYDAVGPATVTYNGTVYYYLRNAQGDVMGLVNAAGQTVVKYAYDAWGKPLAAAGTMAATLGRDNPLRYRGYVYDAETGLYYLKSRYYNPDRGRFINADGYVSTGQGVLGSNMFAYCLNNPVNMRDPSGKSSIWSFESDWAGREILYHWLFGEGKDFLATDDKWGDYMRSNELLTQQIIVIVDSAAELLPNGEKEKIDLTTSAEIENGESIIGYQYLHGTNSDVGGFHVVGEISKSKLGIVQYNLTCTWNDMIDPNFQYTSDQKKAKLANLFANPTDYRLAITWSVAGRRARKFYGGGGKNYVVACLW